MLEDKHQACHFDLTQNLNECEKKSEYSEKNLNLTTKIALLNRNLYQIQREKIWILSQVIWISQNFVLKNLNDSDKIWMNGRSADTTEAWLISRMKTILLSLFYVMQHSCSHKIDIL